MPAFIHITEAKINDVRAMDVIPYESGSFYVLTVHITIIIVSIRYI